MPSDGNVLSRGVPMPGVAPGRIVWRSGFVGVDGDIARGRTTDSGGAAIRDGRSIGDEGSA